MPWSSLGKETKSCARHEVRNLSIFPTRMVCFVNEGQSVEPTFKLVSVAPKKAKFISSSPLLGDGLNSIKVIFLQCS